VQDMCRTCEGRAGCAGLVQDLCRSCEGHVKDIYMMCMTCDGRAGCKGYMEDVKDVRELQDLSHVCRM
jgi:hypothetical protein